MQEQKQQDNKKKQSGKQNVAVYLARVAWRYYSTLIQEAILAAVFVSPLWGLMAFAGLKEITIPVSFPVFWAIGLMVFLLQNSMFRRN
jgi:hypothetical protein